nr:UvrD-helicase domain-containing protein [Fodinicola feengrottensis]
MVDEYQDTNHAQYALIRELVGGMPEKRTVDGDLVRPQATESDEEDLPPAELCVVGDADQSIYAFRGASIRNIMEFERDYPNARTILLEQNYRSTQTILSAANEVITRNTERKPKNLWSDSGDGEKIRLYVADNEHDEAAWVAGEVDRLCDADQTRPGDVAIFYRTNARTVPGFRGNLHPGRVAVQSGRRGAVLRAQGSPGRAGLFAGAVQSGRHGERSAHPECAQAGHRRSCGGLRGRARRPGTDLFFGAALEKARRRRASRPARSTRSPSSPR